MTNPLISLPGGEEDSWSDNGLRGSMQFPRMHEPVRIFDMRSNTELGVLCVEPDGTRIWWEGGETMYVLWTQRPTGYPVIQGRILYGEPDRHGHRVPLLVIKVFWDGTIRLIAGEHIGHTEIRPAQWPPRVAVIQDPVVPGDDEPLYEGNIWDWMFEILQHHHWRLLLPGNWFWLR